MCSTEPSIQSRPEGPLRECVATETTSDSDFQLQPSSSADCGTGESPSPAEQTNREQTVQVSGVEPIAPPSVRLYGESRVRVRHFTARIEEVKG